MPLPVLGVVAAFVARNGLQAAIKKYGPKLARKAAEEVEKRQGQITTAAKAKGGKGRVKDPEFKELQKPTQLTRDAAKGATRAVDRRTDTKSDLFREPNPETPLKLKRGGKVKKSKSKVRGAGIAQRGVRPARIL
tara:strand:+ start:1033 stop:1437 length:405 start_codon:yes stop_codon:yes gene_type:complete